MKYLFFDCDGTLFGKSRFITERTLEEITKIHDAGHKVFFCTGRAPTSIVGGNLEKVPADGFIASAGGFIKADGQMIFRNAIDKRLLYNVLQLFVNHHVLYALETEKAIYQSPGVNEFFDMKHHREFEGNEKLLRFFEYKRQKENRVPVLRFDIDRIGVPKIAFIADRRNEFLDIVQYLADNFNIITFGSENSDFINGEIILKDCTKADGIRRVLEHLGGSMEDTIAFGDSMNDLQMVETVHESYVSELAPGALKAKATGLFKNPDDNGLADCLAALDLY